MISSGMTNVFRMPGAMSGNLAGLLMFSFMLGPVTAGAQTALSGAIAGVVRDTSGAVLPGVTVEAASPALIEKVRAGVTDGQGQYRIVNLRPGPYVVTFSMPGFSTVKREGIDLNTGVTLPVNAELKVGGVAETITVSGASPVVDVQNVRTQSVLPRDVLDALPYAKTFAAYNKLIPGLQSGQTGAATRDVGGTQGEAPLGQRIHGSDPGLTSFDGIKTMSMSLAADRRRLNVNALMVQEIAIETGNGAAEAWSGGVNINVVHKDGGNSFRGSALADYTNQSLSSSNLSSELEARGLTRVNPIKRLWDYGGALGGPIKKDKLWFFVTPRNWGTESTIANNFYNLTPHTLFYTPDLSRPAEASRLQWDFSGRATWQVAREHKLVFEGHTGYQCFCPVGVDTGSSSPEAGWRYQYSPQRLLSLTWTHPATSRLLFEAAVAWRDDGGLSEPNEGVLPTDRSVVESSIGRTYGSNLGGVLTTYGRSPSKQKIGRGSVSYVTGSHTLKAGFYGFSAFFRDSGSPNFPEQYTFRNQLPTSITQVLVPRGNEVRMRLAGGLFAQDQWTVRRLTLNVGLRFDYVDAYSPEQVRPAGEYSAAIPLPAADNFPNWKDINPRLGVAYDLFGNGKTALKVALGRYELSDNFSLVYALANSPGNALVTSTTRTWNDVNGNFVPNCDLKLKTSNGECGAMSNQNFGTSVVSSRPDPALTKGWGVSPYIWQGHVTVQQELAPNVGLTVGYFRTSYGNQTVSDNRAVTLADFDQYCVKAPVDARLPGGGGNQVCGLYDVSRAKFGQVDNLVTSASNFGGSSQVFNGVDVLINARFPRGRLLTGGLSTGQTRSTNCAFPDAPTQFCDTSTPWGAGTDVKLSGVYPLPLGLQASATFQILPGIAQGASYVTTNAEIASSLGRNLSACPAATGTCTATVTLNLVAPNVMYEKRGSQTDVRLSKIFRLGRIRLQGNFDVYNLFNAFDLTSVTTRYGPQYLQPISVMGGRLVKFSSTVDF